MAIIRGIRDTKNVTAADTKLRNVDKLVTLIQPERGPLTTLLDQIGQTRSCNTMKFEHAERDYLSKTVQVNGALSDSATALVVDNASYVKVNTQIYNKTSGEAVRVTAVNTATNTLTIVRAAGGTVAAAIADNEVLILASEGSEEGVAYSDAITNESALLTGYLQEFETAIQMSNIQMTWEEYTNPDWKENMSQAIGEHKEKMEAAFWLGNPELVASGPNNHRIFYTTGIRAFLAANGAANISTITGSLTEAKLSAWLKGVYVYGNPSKKVLFASPAGRLILNRLGAQNVETPRSENTFGNAISRVVINGALLKIVETQLFTKWGLDDHIFAVDMDHVVKRFFAGNGQSWQTSWKISVQANDSKSRKDVLYTICGLQMRNGLAHGQLKGFST